MFEGTKVSKEVRIAERREARLRRKEPAQAAPTGFSCHICRRPCKGNSELQAHLRLGHRWMIRRPGTYNFLIRALEWTSCQTNIYTEFVSWVDENACNYGEECNGSHLIKSTSLEKTRSPVSGFFYARIGYATQL